MQAPVTCDTTFLEGHRTAVRIAQPMAARDFLAVAERWEVDTGHKPEALFLSGLAHGMVLFLLFACCAPMEG